MSIICPGAIIGGIAPPGAAETTSPRFGNAGAESKAQSHPDKLLSMRQRAVRAMPGDPQARPEAPLSPSGRARGGTDATSLRPKGR